jgi:hypothetical protein
MTLVRKSCCRAQRFLSSIHHQVSMSRPSDGPTLVGITSPSPKCLRNPCLGHKYTLQVDNAARGPSLFLVSPCTSFIPSAVHNRLALFLIQ